MKKFALALVAFAFAAPVAATAQGVAPAVKRKPVATAPAPAAPRQTVATPAAPTAPPQSEATLPAPAAPQQSAAPTAPAAPQRAVRHTSEREVQAALAGATGQSGEAALDTSLIRVMSRLVVAGRCGEAASLAARDGRRELAARAQQLCK